MKNNQIVLFEDRGLISISGEDAKNFLQNIISNDINKVSFSNTIFSGLFSPQGKYLFEFFIIKSHDGYLLDCDNKFSAELIKYLSKYKLSSKVIIKEMSNQYAVGIISLEKFIEIQENNYQEVNTITYRESPLFIDPRKKDLGVRILSSLEKLHLTIKKLNLKIVKPDVYYQKSHLFGIPIKGVENLQGQLFGLEANFEKLQAIDFKKGCYIGQENTARMKLKNKLRRKLVAIETENKINIGDNLSYNGFNIGKILISKPLPFALIKLFDPDFKDFKDKELNCGEVKVKIASD